MSVKLYNRTKLPTEPLHSLLSEAMKLVGAKGDVVVKVTRGGRRVTSHARSAALVYRAFLTGKHTHTKLVATDGGYVVMQILHCRRYWNERIVCPASPTGFALRSLSCVDGLATAQHFFSTAVHEFAHIVQFQTGRWQNGAPAAFSRGNLAGHRPKWAKRPEEVDAVNRTDDALGKLNKQASRKARIDELIIALAIQMEAGLNG